MTVVGVLHPGVMGAAVAATLRRAGHDVVWASHGRSAATAERASAAAIRDAGTVEAMFDQCEVVLSICPPHAAAEVARLAAGFRGLFVDANAISPESSAAQAGAFDGRYVDGGIVGPPPTRPGTTRLYLSGTAAGHVAALFNGTQLEPRVLAAHATAASALKMTYAAWTKGTAALLVTIEAVAAELGVAEALHEEWGRSQPDALDRLAAAQESATEKGWRWEAEMREVAMTFEVAGQPSGFHRAAAETFANHRDSHAGKAPPRTEGD